MTSKIALCADSHCLNDPVELGLKGERILDQTWIAPFTDAMIARQYLRKHAVDETWVVSNDSIDGINLAAALKKDNANQAVRLFIPSPSGSKMSRCQNAGIIPICGSREFAHLYTAYKLNHARSRQTPATLQRDTRTQPTTLERMHERSAQLNDQSQTPRTIENKTESSSVKVTRIRRDDPENTTPFPTIDIEDVPLITNVNAPVRSKNYRVDPPTDSSTAMNRTLHDVSCPVPPRKDFAEASNNHPDKPDTLQDATPKMPVVQAKTQEKEAHIVSVISGSGGTGKSAVATMSALLAQKRGIRTLLLDADFQFGDLKYLLGYKDSLDVNDILTHPEQIETLLKQDTWPALLSAPLKLEYSEEAQQRIAELLAYLKPHFDLIVVNTGSFWSEFHLQLIEASNKIFFVVDQRPSSVRACNHALDLCARCGIATTSFSFLLNFCSKKSLLSTLDVSCALKGADVFEIKHGGAEVSELLGAGMAHKLSCVNNLFCSSITGLLEKTVFDQIKPSLSIPEKHQREKNAAPERSRFRGRQKRHAACY